MGWFNHQLDPLQIPSLKSEKTRNFTPKVERESKGTPPNAPKPQEIRPY